MVGDDLHKNIRHTVSEAASIALESFASRVTDRLEPAHLLSAAYICSNTNIGIVNCFLVDTKVPRTQSLLA